MTLEQELFRWVAKSGLALVNIFFVLGTLYFVLLYKLTLKLLGEGQMALPLDVNT